MYCNKPSNGFNNGPCFGYNTYNPPPTCNGISPDSIVGEGVINYLALPDGTNQCFFTPANCWTPNMNPYYNQINPYCNPNGGTWFVRSINVSSMPPFCNYSPCHPALRPLNFPECNMNIVTNGYQLKLHNDTLTSTTDLHRFQPRMRQIEYAVALPSRGCAAVQVNAPVTTSTVCTSEVVNSKVGACLSRHCVDAPVSAMCLDTERKTTEANYECSSCTCKCKKDSCDNECNTQLHLLPTDARNKRIKLEKKTDTDNCECSRSALNINESMEIIAVDPCPPPCVDKCTATDETKVKDDDCECSPPVSMTKSTLARGCNASCEPDCFVDKCHKKLEWWFPKSNKSKKVFSFDEESSEACSSCQYKGYCEFNGR